MTNKIRLLIADDHEVVRSGLKTLVAGTEVKVVGEVATGAEAVKFALENEVDVVLLDIRMPDGDGLTALGRIKLDKPDMPVLILSTFDNPTYVARAVALGASGYVLKGCTRDQLLAAIRIGRDRRKRLDARRTPPRDRRIGHSPFDRRRRSSLDPARKRSPAAVGLWADEQGNRPNAAHQLRDGQRACAAHLAQDRRHRPHPSRGLGGTQGIGLKNQAGRVRACTHVK